MKIINIDAINKRPMDMDGVKDVMVQKPVTSADGSPNFAMRVFTIEKDGHTPYHNHDFEHINYIIDGVGGIKKENGDIESLKKGSFVLVKPNEKHQYVNLGDEPFVMICAVPIEYE